jgi:hypothetical protein
MERSALLSPWRILLGLLPLCYASMLVIEFQNTWLWLGVIVLLVIVLLVLATALDFPLLICWPAFSWCILLCTCAIMLYEGVPAASAVPTTHSTLELWVVGFLAGFALIWVVIRTRLIAEDI